jgi:hypothetical protein
LLYSSHHTPKKISPKHDLPYTSNHGVIKIIAFNDRLAQTLGTDSALHITGLQPAAAGRCRGILPE